jgi:hypothetical protein
LQTTLTNEKAGGTDLEALGMLPVTGNLSVFGKAGLVAARVKTELNSSDLNLEPDGFVDPPFCKRPMNRRIVPTSHERKIS